MFCFQCQEAAKGTGCTVKGMCGKEESTANLQDLLIYDLKGIAVLAKGLKGADVAVDKSVGLFLSEGLFTTITNANFDNDAMIATARQAGCPRDSIILASPETAYRATMAQPLLARA